MYRQFEFFNTSPSSTGYALDPPEYLCCIVCFRDRLATLCPNNSIQVLQNTIHTSLVPSRDNCK